MTLDPNAAALRRDLIPLKTRPLLCWVRFSDRLAASGGDPWGTAWSTEKAAHDKVSREYRSVGMIERAPAEALARALAGLDRDEQTAALQPPSAPCTRRNRNDR